MRSTILGILSIILSLALIALTFTLHKNYKEVAKENITLKLEKQAIIKRALNTDEKDCYTWQEIEIIIFSEIQE